MTALLLFQPLFQCFHQLVEPAKSLDLGAFLGGQQLFGLLFQPVRGQVDGIQHLLRRDVFQPFEGCGKGAVEAVDMPLVFHQNGAGQIIERFDIVGGETCCQPFQEDQVFAHRHRNAQGAQRAEEPQEHDMAV